MKHILIVVDMQRDLVDGAPGTPEAHAAALTTMGCCQIQIKNT